MPATAIRAAKPARAQKARIRRHIFSSPPNRWATPVRSRNRPSGGETAARGVQRRAANRARRWRTAGVGVRIVRRECRGRGRGPGPGRRPFRGGGRGRGLRARRRRRGGGCRCGGRGGGALPPHRRWGGGPAEGWWRGSRLEAPDAGYPSTMLRMVPLPSLRAGSDSRPARAGAPMAAARAGAGLSRSRLPGEGGPRERWQGGRPTRQDPPSSLGLAPPPASGRGVRRCRSPLALTRSVLRFGR